MKQVIKELQLTIKVSVTMSHIIDDKEMFEPSTREQALETGKEILDKGTEELGGYTILRQEVVTREVD